MKLMIAIVLWLSLWSGHPVECASCGIKPIKPIPPIGCKDMVAECVCDAKGKNCQWTWKCVK